LLAKQFALFICQCSRLERFLPDVSIIRSTSLAAASFTLALTLDSLLLAAAFSEAGEATGAPQKEVIGLLASSFTTLMMPPVKSQDSSSGSKTSAAVAMNPPSEDDEENEETLQGLEDEGKQGLAGSPKRGKAVKSKEQQEKAAQAASLRFRKKLDVVIISKVTTSMCTAGVFGSAQLWTSFSRSLQSSKFQPWQASDWGRTLENFSSAAKAKAVPPNNLGPLFQHVAKEIETGETAALLSTGEHLFQSPTFQATANLQVKHDLLRFMSCMHKNMAYPSEMNAHPRRHSQMAWPTSLVHFLRKRLPSRMLPYTASWQTRLRM
jgi:hypothetical protein